MFPTLLLALGIAAAKPAPFCENKQLPNYSEESSYGQGCSAMDYTNCISSCVDDALPWERVSYVNCWYNYYNRSYAVVVCECHTTPTDIKPSHRPSGGPGDVGFGY